MKFLRELLETIESREYTSKPIPFHHKEDIVEAIWSVMIDLDTGKADYLIDTIFSPTTGEIYHQSSGQGPKDPNLKRRMLDYLRLVPIEDHFKDLGYDASYFTDNTGKEQLWIHSIWDNNTGELFHDEMIKRGPRDSFLKKRLLSYLKRDPNA